MKNKWSEVIKMTSLSAVMVAASLWIATDEEFTTMQHLLGWFGVIFFGICGIGWVIKLGFSDNGGVQILEEGLLVSGTMIPWKNIEGFQETDGGILVFTDNVQERLANAGFFKKIYIKLSLLTSKTDILVPSVYYNNAEAFIAECEKYW